MIPKVIHYCWFGHNQLPDLALKCIESWKKYCPDYQIIQWNEENYDISATPLYVRQAYEKGEWAFVSDYIRLHVVYEHGGIYLDTDVELKQSLDSLLEYAAFFGFEDGIYINTGHGFGAEKGLKIVWELMQDYQGVSFILENGELDRMPCPQRNTEVFLNHGLLQNDTRQILDENVLVEPSICFCPIDYKTGKYRRSKKTISVHWFNASWKTQQEKEWDERSRRRAAWQQKVDCFKRIIRKIIGKKVYYSLKKIYRENIRKES